MLPESQTGPRVQVPVSFEAFFQREHPKWLRYARSLLNSRADAEDVVQNAGIKLFELWDRALACEDEDAMRAFALQIVKFKIADVARRTAKDWKRHEPLDANTTTGRLGSDSPEEEVAERVALQQALRELRRDSPQCFDVMSMRQAGMTYRQIAKTLFISESTAKNHQAMAVRFLERRLEAADDHGDHD